MRSLVGTMMFRRPLDCAMMTSMFDFGLQLDLSLRLLGAAALGLVIGFEREIHGHPAGLRTHMLVALGSGLFTVLSIHGFGGEGGGAPVDPTRIAAQIVSGIGFLGAGAILKDGIVVRGLTTAASLWATAAVGMAAGAGAWTIGIVATIVIVVSLWPIAALAERLHGSAQPQVQLRLSLERLEALGDVSAVLVDHKLEIGALGTERLARNHYQANITVRAHSTAAISRTIQEIEKIDGVEILATSQAD